MVIAWRISAVPVSRSRLKPAEISAQPRTTTGRLIRQTTPMAVWKPIRAKVLSPRPISWASEVLSGPRGMLQSHAKVNVPPIAEAHQLTTMLKVATAIGNCRTPCARSSQNWLCVSGIRFQTPAPGSAAR